MDCHHRVRFSREGDIRFLSHLDILRAFERALRRSGLPLAFTAGYNPRVRTSFAQALSVGLESAEEWMLLTLSSEVGPDEVASRLGPCLPPGLALLSVQPQSSRKLPPVASSQWQMCMQRPCTDGLPSEGEDVSLVEHLVAEGSTLMLKARHAGGRSIHPRTVLKLLGYTEEEILSARIRRLRTILDEPSAPNPEPIAS